MWSFLELSKKRFMRFMSIAFALAIVIAGYALPANAQDTVNATYGADKTQYTIGEDVTVTTNIVYTGTLLTLGLNATVPEGWEYVSSQEAGGTAPAVAPSAGDTGDLNFAWITIPASPVNFSYVVRPKDTTGTQQITGKVSYAGTTGNPMIVTLDAITLPKSLNPDLTGQISISQSTAEEYIAGGKFTVSNSITYSNNELDALGVKATLPAGWTYVDGSASGDTPINAAQTGDVVEFTWADIPASPIDFTYSVEVPGNDDMSGPETISATASHIFKDEALDETQATDLTVQMGTLMLSAAHDAGQYFPGRNLVVENSITYTGDVRSLGYEVTLPDENWTYVSHEMTIPPDSPLTTGSPAPEWAQDGQLLRFFWADIPVSPVNFTYTVKAPADATGPQEIAAQVIYMRAEEWETPVPATPNPLTLTQATSEWLDAYATLDTECYESDESTTVIVTTVVEYTGTLNSLGAELDLPAGVSIGGPDKPDSEQRDGNTVKLAWVNIPASPIEFTYTTTIPSGTNGRQEIGAASVQYGREVGGIVTTTVAPATIDECVAPIEPYRIDADVRGNGTIIPANFVYVEPGGSQKFTMTPDEGYELADVEVAKGAADPVSVMGDVVDNTYTFTNVNANYKILATFRSMGIIVCPDLQGGEIIVTKAKASTIIDSAPGFEVTDVQVNDVSEGSIATYQFPDECIPTEADARSLAAVGPCWWPGSCDEPYVEEGCAICATFDESPIKATAENGLVTVLVKDGVRKAVAFPKGTLVPIEVKLDGEDVELKADDTYKYTYTFADGARVFQVRFGEPQETYTIKASAGVGGTIDPLGDITVAAGADQSFAVDPAAGYVVSNVMVDGKSMGALPSYTFKEVLADHTIHVTFNSTDVYYNITVNAGQGGAVSPKGPLTLVEGSDQTFTITPDAGYAILDVLVDGKSVGPVSTYTFTNISADRQISVTFDYVGQWEPLEGGRIIIRDGLAIIDSNSAYEVSDVLVNGASIGSVATFDMDKCRIGARSQAAMDPCWWPGACEGECNEDCCQAEGGIVCSEGETRCANGDPLPEGCEACDACGGELGCRLYVTFADSPITVTEGENGLVTVTVADGVRTATVIPNPGYIADVVTVNGEPVELTEDGTYTFGEGEDTFNVTFKLAGVQYTITATAGANGSITPSGEVKVSEGANKKFTIKPDAGYDVADVVVDGESVGQVLNYTFTEVSADHGISVTFMQASDLRSLTPVAGPGGTIEPSAVVWLNVGESQTFAIAANDGYRVKDVLIDSVSIGVVSEYTFEDVTVNHEIKAVFEQIGAWNLPEGGRIIVRDNIAIIDSYSGYEVTDVKVNGESVGALAKYDLSNCLPAEARSLAAADPCWWPGACEDIACSSDCCADQGGLVCSDGVTLCADGSALSDECADCDACTITSCMLYVTFAESPITVEEGENGLVTIILVEGQRKAVMIPDPGYVADVLTVDGEVVELAGSTYTLDAGEHALSVTFKLGVTPPEEYTITASAGAGGTITPSGEVTVTEGDSQTFAIAAAANYVVASVIVDGASVGAAPSYTFENVTADHSISVSFEPVVVGYSLTATATGQGTIEPSGTIWMDEGASQTFVITPANGYIVKQVTVDGTQVTLVDNTYTFTDIVANHTISVVFEKAPAWEPAEGGRIIVQDGMAIIDSNSAYQVAQVLVNGEDMGSIATFALAGCAGEVSEDEIDPCWWPGACDRCIPECCQDEGGLVCFNGDTLCASGQALAGEECSDCNACAKSPCSIYAVFEESEIEVEEGENGLVTITVGEDGVRKAWVIPSSIAYAVDTVTVDGEVVELEANSYEFAEGAHTMVVTFKEVVVYTITASAGEGGIIEPSGEVLVAGGDDKTFVFTPDDADHRVGVVTVDGVPLDEAEDSYTFEDVDADHTIEVTFVQAVPYEIEATAGENGSIYPAGITVVYEGESQIFTMTPDSEDYEVEDVLVDDVSVGAVATYEFTDVTANHTIHVTFRERVQYVITATAGENGSIDPSGEVLVYGGTDETFTITPADGYRVADVLVDDESAGQVTSYTFEDVAFDHTIHAEFEPSGAGVFVITASAGDNGAINPSGDVEVDENASQTFTMIPNAGYRVSNVVVDGQSVGAVSSYTFTEVAGPHTIAVTFEPIPVVTYTIVATAGENGSVRPSGYIPVKVGNDQTIRIQPNRGYKVGDVEVDGVSQGAITEYTFENVDTDHTIYATFVPGQFTITSSAGANGTISPVGATSLDEGESLQFVMKPNAGYQVAEVTVDGVSVGAVPSYTFTNVKANHTIHATFKASPIAVTYTITVTVGEHGTVSPSGEVEVYEGLARVFTLTPDDGYEVADVVVGGVSMIDDVKTEGDVITYTLMNVTSNNTLSVTFNKKDSGGDDNCFIATAANGSGTSSGVSAMALMLMAAVAGLAGIFLRRNM